MNAPNLHRQDDGSCLRGGEHKSLIDQVPKAAWFAAGWYLQGREQERQAAILKAGGTLPWYTRLFNAITTFFGVILVLAVGAFALICAAVAVYFVYAVIVMTATGGWSGSHSETTTTTSIEECETAQEADSADFAC